MKSHLLAITALAAALALSGCSSQPKPALSTMTGSSADPNGHDQAVEQGSIAPGLQADLAAHAGERVYFALDGHLLSREAQDTLDRQAEWLGRHPAVHAVVAGNCDERGTREYNLALGARRAAAARDYLIGRGVESSRLTTVSYGKERPVALGSDEDAWAQNRNAHTVVIDATPRL